MILFDVPLAPCLTAPVRLLGAGGDAELRRGGGGGGWSAGLLLTGELALLLLALQDAVEPRVLRLQHRHGVVTPLGSDKQRRGVQHTQVHTCTHRYTIHVQ